MYSPSSTLCAVVIIAGIERALHDLWESRETGIQYAGIGSQQKLLKVSKKKKEETEDIKMIVLSPSAGNEIAVGDRITGMG